MVHRSGPHCRSNAVVLTDNNNASTPVELQSSLPSLRFDLLANECMTWLHTGKLAAVPKQATGHIGKVTSHSSCRDTVFDNWCSTSCTLTGWQLGRTPARGTPLRDLAAHVPELEGEWRLWTSCKLPTSLQQVNMLSTAVPYAII